MSYWLIALTLIAFGMIAALSIGAPFFVVGVVLLVLGPFRRRPLVFWPVLLAVVSGILAYVLLVPMFCTVTSELGASGETICRNLAGQRWVGGEAFSPPFEPARSASIVVAVVVGVACLLGLTLWSSRRN